MTPFCCTDQRPAHQTVESIKINDLPFLLQRNCIFCLYVDSSGTFEVVRDWNKIPPDLRHQTVGFMKVNDLPFLIQRDCISCLHVDSIGALGDVIDWNKIPSVLIQH